MATACNVDIADAGSTFDLRQNAALGNSPDIAPKSDTHVLSAGQDFASIFESKFGSVHYSYGIAGASTDFVSSSLH